MWITSAPLEVDEAKAALQKAVPNLEEYLEKGQIEIISYTDWYLIGGKFDSNRVLQGWVQREQAAIKRGFEGLRLTGNTLWIERDLWNSFVDYEEAINSVIGEHHMLALCTYCLKNCTGTDVLDVVRNHIGTLVKQNNKWYLIEDATRRKALNSVLKLTEKKYSALFENMQDGFVFHKIIYDEKGEPIDYVFIEVNSAFERLTGLRRRDVLGKKATEVLPGIEKDSADWIGTYGKVAKTGKPIRFENYAAGLQRWYMVSAFCPQEGYFVATFEDVTERKNAEAALRESEQRWATTVSSIGDAIIATDTEGNITFMNHVAEEVTGWKLDEAKCKPLQRVFNIINEFTREEVESPVEKVIKVGSIVGLANHTILIKKDLSEVPIDDSGAPIKGKDGKTMGVVLVFRDIAERKKAEKDLKETRNYLENLLNYANAPIIVWDPQFRITLFNHAFERLTGLVSNEVLGKSLEILFPPDRKQEAMAHIERAVKGEYWETVEIPILDTGNNVKTVLWNSANIHDPQGSQVIATIAQGHDITERKQVEQALHRAKADWERTFDSVPDLIAILDDKHRIVRVNQAMAQTLAATPEKCIGLNCYKCVHGTDAPPPICPHSKAMKDGQEHTAEVHEETLGGDFLVSATPLKDDQGRILGSVHVARNITVRKQMEKKLEEYSKQLEQLVEIRTKQLRDSERLAAIGATAGMVGHDIRNPLQAITGDLYLAKEELATYPDSECKASLYESLLGIEQNVEYINKIVADLQDFARPLNPTITETNLKGIIDGLVNNQAIPKNVQIQSIVEKDAETIQADSAYIRRVISNLINNAVQAMPSGGTLTVKAYVDKKDTVITVADTGVGIPKETQGKLFTPLFTTKSKGQGFGLAVVKRMTEAHGGTVTFESEPNKGTRFIIRLPNRKSE